MSTAMLNAAVTHFVPSEDWQETKGYMIHALITKDEDGTFTAVALNLPGAVTSGDTEEEAKDNIKEAVCGLIESYKAEGDPIPWKDVPNTKFPFEAKYVRLMVYA